MASYSELRKRPASDFLNAFNFRTVLDVSKDCKGQRYFKALEEMRGYTAFHIGAENVWSADCKGGSYLSSYEGIGYHSNTAELLQAALDSDCAFYVYRYEGNNPVKYDIRAMQA